MNTSVLLRISGPTIAGTFGAMTVYMSNDGQRYLSINQIAQGMLKGVRARDLCRGKTASLCVDGEVKENGLQGRFILAEKAPELLRSKRRISTREGSVEPRVAASELASKIFELVNNEKQRSRKMHRSDYYVDQSNGLIERKTSLAFAPENSLIRQPCTADAVKYVSITELAKINGMAGHARKLNTMLEQAGLQTKSSGKWQLTDKGLEFAIQTQAKPILWRRDAVHRSGLLSKRSR